MNKTYDVGIVGGGAVALGIAVELLKKDSQISIAVFRPKTSEGGASIAAGAMLGCFTEVTSRARSSAYGQAKFELSYQALKRWSDWVDEIESQSTILKDQPIITARGTYVVQNTDSGHLDDLNYQAILDCLDEYKEPYELISPNDIEGYQPIDSSRSLNALYLESERAIDPSIAAEKFENVLTLSNRVTFHDCYITDLIQTPNSVQGVIDAEGQQYHCDQVVLAAGVYTQDLIDKTPIKYRIPRLYSGVGNGFTARLESTEKTTLSDCTIRTPNRSFACGLHIVPRGGSEFYVGATNNILPEPQQRVRIDLVNFLSSCVMQQINKYFHMATFSKLLCGNRPVSLDTYPLIGKTSIQGLTIATGTYRDGLEQSPYIADYIGDLVLDRTIPEEQFKEFAYFQPERYPVSTLTREEALEEAIQHYVAGVYEHNSVMPMVGWTDLYDDLLRFKISNIYDEFSEYSVLSPDFVLMVNEHLPAQAKEQLLNHFREAAKAF